MLVEVDFPKGKRQSEDLKEQNQKLKQKYGQTMYPTFVLIGKDGGEAARSFDMLDLEKWFAFIDEMPMRRAEILQQKQASDPEKN